MAVTLDDSLVGRRVRYYYPGQGHGGHETGVVTSVSKTFAFVRYDADVERAGHAQVDSKATPPDLLTAFCRGCNDATEAPGSREGLCRDCLPLDLPGYSGA